LSLERRPRFPRDAKDLRELACGCGMMNAIADALKKVVHDHALSEPDG
jgi:hypothetical protein